MARRRGKIHWNRALGVAVGFAASALAVPLLPVPFVWIFLGWGAFCIDTTIRGRGKIGRRVSLSLGVVFLVLGIAEGVFAIKEKPRAKRTPSVARKTGASGPTSFVGADGEPTTYIKLHERLGHAPVANNVVTASRRFGTETLYDVSYTIDSNGLRLTPSSAEDGELPCILFFGGSFTFGEGVADEESMPYVVGAKTEGRYRVLNFGFHAYGPHQMLAALEYGIVDEIATCEPRYVFYQAIVAHITRAAGVSSSDRHGPRYRRLRTGELFYDGQFDDEESRVPAELAPRRSALYHGVISKSFLVKEIHRGTVIFSGNLELLVAIVDRSRRLIERRWPEAEFHVILWNERFEIRNLRLGRALSGEGFRVHRISDILPGYLADRDRYRLGMGDRHPNALAHAMIADYIVGEVLELRDLRATSVRSP